MQLSCVQCSQALPMGAIFCNACGRPVDADRDGVPDALGKMIEAKARAIVEEQRKADRDAEAAVVQAGQLSKLKVHLSETELALAENGKLPRTFLRAFGHLARFYAILVLVVWLLLGPAIHFLFSVIDVSPAGVVLCSSHCDGCSGPGRTFAWSFKGSWQEKKGRMGYALVCHNKEIDIDRLKWSDVRNDPLNTELQPYMIHGFVAYIVNGLVLSPTLGLTLAIVFTNKRRRRWDEQRSELDQKVKRLRAQLNELEENPVPDVATFRG